MMTSKADPLFGFSTEAYSLVAALAAATLAGAAGIATTALGRRPAVDRADYADRLVGASVGLVEELQEEVARYRVALAEMKEIQDEERVKVDRALANEQERTIHCEHRFDRLVAYLRQMGLDPPDE